MKVYDDHRVQSQSPFPASFVASAAPVFPTKIRLVFKGKVLGNTWLRLPRRDALDAVKSSQNLAEWHQAWHAMINALAVERGISNPLFATSVGNEQRVML